MEVYWHLFADLASSYMPVLSKAANARYNSHWFEIMAWQQIYLILNCEICTFAPNMSYGTTSARKQLYKYFAH